MKVLTFNDNDGRDTRRIIHACNWKHHLPSYQPDQILQVLYERITVRKGKEGLYYTEWKTM